MKIIEKIKAFFIDQKVEALTSKLEYEQRKNIELGIKNKALEDQYKNLFYSVKKFFELREKKDSKTWKLVETQGKDFWFRPEHLTYVSEMVEDKGIFTFNMIVDTNLMNLSYTSRAECESVRMTLLNVERIPSPEDVSDEKKKERIVRAFSKEKSDSTTKEEELKKPKIDVQALEKSVKNRKK